MSYCSGVDPIQSVYVNLGPKQRKGVEKEKLVGPVVVIKSQVDYMVLGYLWLACCLSFIKDSEKPQSFTHIWNGA
ncbi:hypothetical protein L1987_83591 [Smallanthus sonchifolius]|uniref:Uncharacterized protein n=1 Tax=Smallanthus sonchifolius TaxID=185202 RepID=A0ACB8YDH4_9ASTR|nr:hypothetical protein L1987_83591 [Smallanthus sonchifolius]